MRCMGAGRQMRRSRIVTAMCVQFCTDRTVPTCQNGAAGWPENSCETKMPADQTTVRYLFPRLSAFTRTRTFIAVLAFIVGVNVGIMIGNYEHRQALHVLDAKIDAIKAQTDILKRPSDQQK
jgi:hypothetical protein